MLNMIDILVDDRKFVVSRETLNLSPDFLITRLLNGTVQIEDYSFAQKIDENTFRLDVIPTVFDKILTSLRMKGDEEQRRIKSTLMILNSSEVDRSTSRSGDEIDQNKNSKLNDDINDHLSDDESVELSLMDPVVLQHVLHTDPKIEGSVNRLFKKSETGQGISSTDPNTLTDTMNQELNQNQGTSAESSQIFSKMNGQFVKQTNPSFDPLNSKSLLRSDQGIFRRPDTFPEPHRGGVTRSRKVHAKQDVYVDFSAMSSDANLSDVNQWVGKISKQSRNSTDFNDTMLKSDTNTLPNSSISQFGSIDHPTTNSQCVIPKGHHVYRSRKIELNTSEDRS